MPTAGESFILGLSQPAFRPLWVLALALLLFVPVWRLIFAVMQRRRWRQKGSLPAAERERLGKRSAVSAALLVFVFSYLYVAHLFSR